MDTQQLWQVIQDIQTHTEVMNHELGMAQVDIAWLKASWWEMINWMRVIGGGIVVGVFLSGWNLVISRKNGKK